MDKPIKYLDLAGLKALYGVVDEKIKGAKTDLEDKIKTNTDAIGVLNGNDTTEGSVAKAIADEVTARNTAITTAIEGLDVTDTAVDGQFVTAVSEVDGKVEITRGKVAADKVTAEAVTAADAVAVAEGTVASQIASLAKSLKTVEGNAAKYKVVKLTEAEVKALPDGANVKEAYQVVSYVGDEATATKTPVGETIKIYKDGNLKSAALGTGENAQKLILTYTTADGSDDTVVVDFAAIAFNTEFKNGLQVAENGEVSVKIDGTSETYLTVGADGVKLAGVKKAIDDAVAAKNVTAEGDDYITATAANNKVTVAADVQGLTITTTAGASSTIAGVEKSLVDGKEIADKITAFTNARISEEIAKLDVTVGETTVAVDKHVAVQVVESDGKITAVNVKENDIASDAALTSEIERAKNAEKANADAIATMSVNTTTQTVKIKDDSLIFTALSNNEIQSAWNDKVSPTA